MSSFLVPAWAVHITEAFSRYSPASWVIAGFAGLTAAATSYWLFTAAYRTWVRTKYNARLYERSGFVDPMAKTFEDKRIYLSDFCLPSHPLIDNKTFINCEIIGPSNLVLEYSNNVTEQKYPICDAVLLKKGQMYYNATLVRTCTFRHCSFQRVTFLFPVDQYEQAKDVNWLNWITDVAPGQTPSLSQAEALSIQPPPSIEEKTPP